MKGKEILNVIDLRVYYRVGNKIVKAVDGVTLKIYKNEIFGIAGESGCGKSTLARAMLNLVEPPAYIAGGKILFENIDLLSLDDESMRKFRWRRISYIPQSSMYALNPTMKIRDQIADAIVEHSMGILDKDRNTLNRLTQKLIQMVGLPERVLEMYPHELSGGMRQRVCIAMAMALNPSLIIADEPTTALDVVVQKGVLRVIANIREKFGTTIVLISHNMGIHAQTVDRLAIMYAGKVVEVGNVHDIFSRPLHPYTKGLIKSVPSIKHGEISGIPGLPPDLMNPPSGCRFHPRCPLSIEKCKVNEPIQVEVKPDHFVSCHLVGG